MTVFPKTFSTIEERQQQVRYLKSQLKNSSGWFYWIAGLSIANSIGSLLGLSISFVVGLGASLFVDALAMRLSEYATKPGISGIMLGAGFLFNLFIAGIFALCGLLSRKEKLWALIIGLILYSGDTILMLVFKDWFGALFHAWALYGLFKGIGAIKKIKMIQEAIPETAIPIVS